jgi:hypothetical protein
MWARAPADVNGKWASGDRVAGDLARARTHTTEISNGDAAHSIQTFQDILPIVAAFPLLQ